MPDDRVDTEPLRLRVIDGGKSLRTAREAASAAAREGRELEVVVLYKPASRRTLERARQVVPDELQWRVHGAMLADQMTQTVLQIAREEDVSRVNIRCEVDPAG